MQDRYVQSVFGQSVQLTIKIFCSILLILLINKKKKTIMGFTVELAKKMSVTLLKKRLKKTLCGKTPYMQTLHNKKKT